jgi:hypothetical protein
MGNHRNSGPISRIDHLDPTPRLGLRGGFEIASRNKRKGIRLNRIVKPEIGLVSI